LSKYLDKVEEKIKNFEMAFVPDKGSFVLPKLNSILLALDAHEWAIDSSRVAIQTAAELSQYHGAFIQIICMAVNESEYVESEILVSEAVEYFQLRKIDCSGLCIIGSPSTNILKLVEDESHDLVIMPSPYAERIEKENLDSLGTTVELVINNSKVPVLLMTESISKLGRS
jgi:nucleotide-binding universal stress UspA family protein